MTVIKGLKIDGFVKSPSAALRFTFVVAAYHPSTPHSSGFARLASGAFYEAISLATFYEIIKSELTETTKNLPSPLFAKEGKFSPL